MTVYDIIFHGEICLHVAVGGLHTPTECVGELVYKKFEVITNITIWVLFFQEDHYLVMYAGFQVSLRSTVVWFDAAQHHFYILFYRHEDRAMFFEVYHTQMKTEAVLLRVTYRTYLHIYLYKYISSIFCHVNSTIGACFQDVDAQILL